MTASTVIFACVHNAGRSQMAAAFFTAQAEPTRARAVSAGTQPGERVHPEVVAAMRDEICAKVAALLEQQGWTRARPRRRDRAETPCGPWCGRVGHPTRCARSEQPTTLSARRTMRARSRAGSRRIIA